MQAQNIAEALFSELLRYEKLTQVREMLLEQTV
jgi:hypothetical protein